GFRLGYEGSQDYDLMLRFVEQTKNVYHIKKVLYHWRKVATSVSLNSDAKSYAYEAGLRALEDYLQRNKMKGRVEMLGKGLYEIRR
ncbi:MAG: glycosyl transferase family 2, partial [uncultured bacterium]